MGNVACTIGCIGSGGHKIIKQLYRSQRVDSGWIWASDESLDLPHTR